MNRKGFTLIEIMIAVIILGLLVSLAMPIYNKIIEKTKAGEAVNNLRLIQVEEKRFFSRRGYFAYDETPGDRKGIELLNKELSLENPNKNPHRYFDYSVYQYSENPPDFEVKAKRRNDAGLPYRNHEYIVHKDGIVTGPLL